MPGGRTGARQSESPVVGGPVYPGMALRSGPFWQAGHRRFWSVKALGKMVWPGRRGPQHQLPPSPAPDVIDDPARRHDPELDPPPAPRTPDGAEHSSANTNAVPQVSHRWTTLTIPSSAATWPRGAICSLWQTTQRRSQVWGKSRWSEEDRQRGAMRGLCGDQPAGA
jgi:hypothetical protein